MAEVIEGVIDSGTTGCGIATEETEGEGKGVTGAAGVGGARTGGTTFLVSLEAGVGLWAVAKDATEPFIVASLLLRSSKGVPKLLVVLVMSVDNRPGFWGLVNGVRLGE